MNHGYGFQLYKYKFIGSTYPKDQRLIQATQTLKEINQILNYREDFNANLIKVCLYFREFSSLNQQLWNRISKQEVFSVEISLLQLYLYISLRIKQLMESSTIPGRYFLISSSVEEKLYPIGNIFVNHNFGWNSFLWHAYIILTFYLFRGYLLTFHLQMLPFCYGH